MSDFVQKIAQYILEEECFNGFKFRKSDCSFSLRKNGILRRVLFEEWVDDGALIVRPYYILRIDKLHKWYEPYHFKSVSDQRSGWTVIYSGKSFDEIDSYRLAEPDFNETIEIMKFEIVRIFETTFADYCNLEGFFINQVQPITKDNSLLPDGGIDWAFEYLAATKIIAPELYDSIESIVLDRLRFLNDKGEPNVTNLYSQIPVILEALNNEFTHS